MRPEIVEALDVLLERLVLDADVAYLELEQPDVLESLPVLLLAAVQRVLEDLGLLVDERHLVVAAHQLRSDQVSLFDHLRRAIADGRLRSPRA